MRRILILGGGFGGLRVAVVLSRKLRRLGLHRKHEIILVDRNDHHAYTPLLYEVATTSKEVAGICELHSIATHNLTALASDFGFTFTQGEVASLDVAHGNLRIGGKVNMPYDYLVIALGSEVNFFSVPGLKERALALKSFQDAIRIRDIISNLAMEGAQNIRIAIGGAGPSGVEIAGELTAWQSELAEEFSGCRFAVSLIEAGPSILPGLDSRIIRLAEHRLRRLGVTMYAGARITHATDGEVALADQRRIPYDVLIWAGGTRGASILSSLPLRLKSHGQISVLGLLECVPETPTLKLHKKTYALGDAVCFYDPATQKPVPGVARAAILQGNIVAHNILEDILVEEKVKPAPEYRSYRPREYPYVVAVGGKYAVAKVGPVIVNGFFGWILKGLVELNYLFSILPPWRAIKIWLKGFKIFIQNDRLG